MIIIAIATPGYVFKVYEDYVLIYEDQIKYTIVPYIERIAYLLHDKWDFIDAEYINKDCKEHYSYCTVRRDIKFTPKMKEMLESNDDELKIMAIDLMVNG